MKRLGLLPLVLALGCSCGHPRAGVRAAPPLPPKAAVAAPQPADPSRQYGHVLVVPGQGAELDAAVADASNALRGLTGAEFRVERGTALPARAIVAVLASSPEAPPGSAKRLSDRGPEAFVLHGNADRLYIVANTDAGRVHGLYEFLRQLGCRWFLPGEEWSVVPRRADLRLAIDALHEPAFRSRTFFGTGGFGKPIPSDPELAGKAKWDVWKRRNGFGASFIVGGHTGEAFNAAHRAVLEAHPEYLAMVGGKRVPWSPSAKLCISNPEARALYVEDRVAAARAAKGAFAVSAEPGDGGGFCECPRCRAIGNGSVSDQVFFLANEVARAVGRAAPDTRVSLYAYSTHAGLPSFPIEPNVYVVAVPEGWQRSGLSPDQLLAAWAGRGKPFGVYTYWALPDDSKDMPVFDWRSTPRESIRKWHRHGAWSVALETTNGAGTSGLGLYLAGRLMWNPDADDRAIAAEFFSLAFGPAAPPMRRMLERWASDFMLMGHELALCYRDLTEARAAARTENEVLARIALFEQYVNHMRLWYEYVSAPPKSAERIHRASDVAVWASRVQSGTMVASQRIRDLILVKGEPDPVLRASFALNQWQAEGWRAAARPVDERERDRLLQQGLGGYHPLPVERRFYSTRLVPLERRVQSVATPGTMRFVGPTEFEFEVPASTSGLEVVVTVAVAPHAPLGGDLVTLTAPDGTVALSTRVPANGVPQNIPFPVAGGGRYRLRVEDQKVSFTLRPPAGVPMSFGWFMSADVSPPMYFFVPKGLRRIAFYGWSAAPMRLSDADGREVPVERTALFTVEVPPGQDGRVWSVRNYKASSPLRLLNAPQSFALSPDAVMIPEDAER